MELGRRVVLARWTRASRREEECDWEWGGQRRFGRGAEGWNDINNVRGGVDEVREYGRRRTTHPSCCGFAEDADYGRGRGEPGGRFVCGVHFGQHGLEGKWEDHLDEHEKWTEG